MKNRKITSVLMCATPTEAIFTPQYFPKMKMQISLPDSAKMVKAQLLLRKMTDTLLYFVVQSM
jgi:hypothetical protein